MSFKQYVLQNIYIIRKKIENNMLHILYKIWKQHKIWKVYMILNRFENNTLDILVRFSPQIDRQPSK